MTVLDSSVLVLNRVYQPINITTVRRAFVLLYQGTAKAIDKEFRTFDFESWAALSATTIRKSASTRMLAHSCSRTTTKTSLTTFSPRRSASARQVQTANSPLALTT